MSDGAGRRPDDWHRILSTRAAVWLALLVAGLSVVTGIVNIEQQAADFGPLAPHVPPMIQQAVGFTGALTGFLMVAAALALRRGLRAGWYATVILLPVTAIQGALQASRYSLPLIGFSLVALPVLLVTRSRFDRQVSLSTTQIAAGGALVGVLAYGTAGSYALREQFDGMETALDAFYYTLVTASTVGYGDITPTSPAAKLFSLSVLVLGVASFGIAIGVLVGPAIQARLSKALGKMTDSELELLENHVLVLGYGELTEPIVDELADGDAAFVVVTANRDVVPDLADRGIPVVTGNPSDEDPLRRANVDRARAVVVATNHDAEDALAILTARQLRPDVRIVSAATDRENIRKLERAGADAVISPAVLGGHLLVRSALGADESATVDRILDE
ncbi:NAD-binding protein [Salinilacihabitans rarus]|uniref:NAD-binding protein n=1 Tax=Salinilacihabitans rarus TaxID=2961596 RepID=UPI0020C91206|nr:NAD-binding protein [Salinilacihabitans rarus]